MYSDACLAAPFFNEWIEYSNEIIEYGRCAGYKIPLFLGGEDTVANLENSDMEVYWGVMSQIKSQTYQVGAEKRKMDKNIENFINEKKIEVDEEDIFKKLFCF